MNQISKEFNLLGKDRNLITKRPKKNRRLKSYSLITNTDTHYVDPTCRGFPNMEKAYQTAKISSPVKFFPVLTTHYPSFMNREPYHFYLKEIGDIYFVKDTPNQLVIDRQSKEIPVWAQFFDMWQQNKIRSFDEAKLFKDEMGYYKVEVIYTLPPIFEKKPINFRRKHIIRKLKKLGHLTEKTKDVVERAALIKAIRRILKKNETLLKSELTYQQIHRCVSSDDLVWDPVTRNLILVPISPYDLGKLYELVTGMSYLNFSENKYIRDMARHWANGQWEKHPQKKLMDKYFKKHGFKKLDI